MQGAFHLLLENLLIVLTILCLNIDLRLLLLNGLIVIVALCRSPDLLLKITTSALFLHKLSLKLLDLINLVLNAVQQVLLLLMQNAQLMLEVFITLRKSLDLHRALV